MYPKKYQETFRNVLSQHLPSLVVAILISCAVSTPASGQTQSGTMGSGRSAKTTTMTGEPLRIPDWSPQVRARLQKDLEIAWAVRMVAPEREDSYIWLGRRLGYLTRWSEAIEVFTQGLEKFPNSYKLLRFRGRHLARSRKIEAALADYRRAAELVEHVQDSFEPDGIINARHQFLGTYRSNIHYYLGQTSWAAGDYEGVLRGMERSAREPLTDHADRLVATTYWRYLALRRLGRHGEAADLADAVPEGLDLVENFTYYDAVLYFKGVRSEEELLPEADSIVKFAIATKALIDGNKAYAQLLWEEIIDASPQGFWPAEYDLLQAREDL